MIFCALSPAKVRNYFLLLGLWCGVVLSQNASATVVKNIKFNGLDRIEKASAMQKLKVKIGEDLHGHALNQALKRLYASEYFYSVDINLKADGTMLITVVENPIVNKVEIGGVSSKIGDVILKELSTQSRAIYTKEKVKYDCEKLLMPFRKSGKINTTVLPRIEKLPRNRVNVLFDVQDSQPNRVESILLIHSDPYFNYAIKKVIKNKPSIFWLGRLGGKIFEEDSLDIDRAAIQNIYVNSGYVNAEVKEMLAEYDKYSKGFVLSLNIDEGQRYTFGLVLIEGPKEINLSIIPTSSIKFKTGDLYEQAKINATISSITYALAEKGYAFVKIDPISEKDEKNLTVNIKFLISEARPAYVGGIRIFGNTRSYSSTILNNIYLREGDLYNRALIEKSRFNLLATGYFDVVEIKEKPTDKPDIVDLEIIIVDKKQTGSISGTVGYSTLEFITLNLNSEKRNIFGKELQFREAIMLSGWRRVISLSLLKHHFLGGRASAGIDVSYTNIDPLQISILNQLPPYVQNSFSISLREMHELLAGVYQSFALNFRYDALSYKDNSTSIYGSAPSLYVDRITNSTMSMAIIHSLSWDRRDNQLVPTKGGFVTVTNSIGLPIPYFVNYFSNDFFGGFSVPLFKDNLVLSLLVRAGAIFLYKDSTNLGVPFQYEFADGYYTFPGAQFGAIGPHAATQITDTNGNVTTSYYANSVRGQWHWTVAAELRAPVPFIPKSYQLHGVFSVVVGSAWGASPNYPSSPGGSGVGCHNNEPWCYVAPNGSTVRQYVVDTAAPRVGIELGILWISPMGPIRISGTWLPVAQLGDSAANFRITFAPIPI